MTESNHNARGIARRTNSTVDRNILYADNIYHLPGSGLCDTAVVVHLAFVSARHGGAISSLSDGGALNLEI